MNEAKTLWRRVVVGLVVAVPAFVAFEADRQRKAEPQPQRHRGRPKTRLRCCAAWVVHLLATRLRDRGRYPQAARWHRFAVALAGPGLAGNGAALVGFLNEFGMSCKYAGRFDEGAAAYWRALTLVHQAGGPREQVATLEHNLGGLAHARGEPVEAEPHARRALQLREAALGPVHPEVAAELGALARILLDLGCLDEAERLLGRAVEILRRTYGPDHHEMGVVLGNLAAVCHRAGRLDRAAERYLRALAIKQYNLGPGHPSVATTLNNLALLRKEQGRPHDAEDLFRRASGLLHAKLDCDHPTLLACADNLAHLHTSPPSRTRPPARTTGPPAAVRGSTGGCSFWDQRPWLVRFGHATICSLVHKRPRVGCCAILCGPEVEGGP